VNPAPGSNDSTLPPAASELIAALLPRCTFPDEGQDVTCAVSGGADSLALLVLAVATGCQVTAVHVDHGLREGSAAEADIVRDAAHRFGATFRSERVTVMAGPNLEARARDARRAVLPPDALTGHTADDQAETVLLNLIRGAGLDGLAAMAPKFHPILGLRRHETHALCAAVGLTPVVDPSNDDPRFWRNRVRHEALPLLADIAQRDVAALVARQAALLRDDADYLNLLAAALDPTDARALAAAPPALARRAIRLWVGAEHPPDAAAVERILRVARGETIACEIEGGRRVSRTDMRLRIEAPPIACPPIPRGQPGR
jgi:tRNA(Ile)-lysidine synthase